MGKKDRKKRLSRCGSCLSCRTPECGTCFSCTDKPKYGGSGVKKKACTNRKCQSFSRSKEGDFKRTVSKLPREPEAPTKLSLPNAVLSDSTPYSPSTVTDQVWLIINTGDSESLPTSDSPLGSPWSPVAKEATKLPPEGSTMSVDEHEGLHTLERGERMHGHTQTLLEYLEWRKGCSGELKQMREVDTADVARECGRLEREWPTLDVALLHEEFISVNEQHRRESLTIHSQADPCQIAIF